MFVFFLNHSEIISPYAQVLRNYSLLNNNFTFDNIYLISRKSRANCYCFINKSHKLHLYIGFEILYLNFLCYQIILIINFLFKRQTLPYFTNPIQIHLQNLIIFNFGLFKVGLLLENK